MQAAVICGIDWANEEHRVFVTDTDGRDLFECRTPHKAAELFALCDRLVEAAGGSPREAWVAIERPHGLVVEALLSRDIRVFSINPKQLDRFRDCFSPSGAKDDRRDAMVLCSSLRTDLRAFREVQPDAPIIVELREWSRMRHEEQGERTRLGNRLREQLLRYFPQMLDLDGDPGKRWMIALWRRVRTPEHAHHVDLRTIAPILKKHRIRKVTPARVLEVLQAGPFAVAEGVTAAAAGHIEHLIDRIEVLNDQLKVSEEHCGFLVEKLVRDESLLHGADPFQSPAPSDGSASTAAILRSMPGIGAVVIGALLGEASQLLVTGNIAGLRLLGGIAPVTKSSGKSCHVMRRLAANPRLRDALHHMAGTAMQHDPSFRRRYTALRGRGHTHGRALRQLADTMLRILAAMLRDRSFYRQLPTGS